jgi:hypothetical protein
MIFFHAKECCEPVDCKAVFISNDLQVKSKFHYFPEKLQRMLQERVFYQFQKRYKAV